MKYMKLPVYVFLGAMLWSCSASMNMKEGKRLYDAGEYAKADKLYSAAEKSSKDAAKMRARCKYKMKDVQAAIMLFQTADKSLFDLEDWLAYSDALIQVGRGAEVKGILLQAGVAGDSIISGLEKSWADVETAKSNNTGWNPKGYAFSPVVFNDRTYYVGNDRAVKHFQDAYDGDGSSYLDVRSAQPEQSYKTPIPLNKINSGDHDGPFSINADGNLIVFTRNVAKSKKKPGGGRPQLFMLQKVNGKWSKAKRLSICNEDAAFMHPALSPDGTKNVFFF